MAHLVARLGDLFHFALTTHKSTSTTSPDASAQAVSIPPTPTPASEAADDLAFFSLSVEHPVENRLSDLDRLGLILKGEEPLQELD